MPGSVDSSFVVSESAELAASALVTTLPVGVEAIDAHSERLKNLRCIFGRCS